MDRIIAWICFCVLRPGHPSRRKYAGPCRIGIVLPPRISRPPAVLCEVGLSSFPALVLTAATPPLRSPVEWSLSPALRALLDQSLEVFLQVEVRAHWILVYCFPRQLPSPLARSRCNARMAPGHDALVCFCRPILTSARCGAQGGWVLLLCELLLGLLY